MHIIRSAVLAASLVLLAACASLPPEVPYDRSAASDIRSIGIITPSMADKATVVLASSAGGNFGLIGLAIDESLQSRRDAKFGDVLQQQNFAATDALTQALTAKLEAQGYTVFLIPVARSKQSFVDHYPLDLEPKVDAYLDLVAPKYGYVAASIKSSTPYRPTMTLTIRLVRAKDAAVLMQDNVYYNAIDRPEHVITIAPDPTYQFVDFDALMADPEKATMGLRIAIEQSAQAISTLLK